MSRTTKPSEGRFLSFDCFLLPANFLAGSRRSNEGPTVEPWSIGATDRPTPEAIPFGPFCVRRGIAGLLPSFIGNNGDDGVLFVPCEEGLDLKNGPLSMTFFLPAFDAEYFFPLQISVTYVAL